MSHLSIIIVGGGLAGPLLASGLLDSGIKVQIFERLAADSKRDGYQIRFAQPCLRAFQQTLTEDQCARISQKLGSFSSNEKHTTPIWYDFQMKELLNMARVSTEYHGSAPMDRAVLRNNIMERPLQEKVVRFNKSFTRYEITGNEEEEKVRVCFDDGTFSECDILIAADGNHSKVNQQIGLNNIEAVPAMNFLTKARLSKETLQRLPEAARKSPILCFSHKKTYFYVAYLSVHHDGLNATQDKPSDEPNLDETAATFTFSLMMHKSDVPEGIRYWSNAAKWDYLADSIASWHPTYRQVIDVIKGEKLYIFEPRGSKRPPLDWRARVSSKTDPSRGHPRVWVLGNAVHPMLPNRGMGGNQAMLDTAMILPLLKQLQESAKTTGVVRKSDISKACAEYEKEIIPRAFQ